MNQRLLAWHGTKAGMDDERKEGRRWAERGRLEGKSWRDAMVRGFFHLLSLIGPIGTCNRINFSVFN